MSQAAAPPEPTYSVRPVWNAAIGYLLLLVAVLGLQSFLLGPTVEMDYYRWTQFGSLAGLISGASLWGWTTRFRATGFATWTSLPLAVALAFTVLGDHRTPTLGALAGFSSCFGFLALFWYVVSFPVRGLPVPVRKRVWLAQSAVLFGTLFAAVAYTLADRAPTDGFAPFAALAAAVLFAIWSWTFLNRAAAELFFETPLTIMYAVRCGGPGLNTVPVLGPVLVIGNHACWFDPTFVSKGLPRPATPMMTARFYKIWFLRPVLKYVFRVIVVLETPIRREAPELRLAIAALDRGDCVMLFPEGYLRRKEEVPLRRFGQGVWQILKERPETPVVACWVEGGWGAWCSFYNGPPTKNKRIDFRRPMRVGMSVAEAVPAELLDDHLRTRIYLMNRVRAVRATLGLPELANVELPSRQDEPPPQG